MTPAYHKFLELFRANEYKIKYGKKGVVKQEWIDYTEQELGFSLPDSYKWWSQEFEYFKVEDEYVKYVSPPENYNIADVDSILYLYKSQTINNATSQNELTILEEGEGDALYYFLIEPGLNGNEYRVFCRDYMNEDDDFYADDFFKFLEMKIHQMK